MYAWIFEKLPGPLWARILMAVVLIVGVVLVLMEFVFPRVSQYSSWNEPTIGMLMGPVSDAFSPDSFSTARSRIR